MGGWRARGLGGVLGVKSNNPTLKGGEQYQSTLIYIRKPSYNEHEYMHIYMDHYRLKQINTNQYETMCVYINKYIYTHKYNGT